MKVLFVCRANVGRSQMASALFNKFSKKNRSTSSGTDVKEKDGKPLFDSQKNEGRYVLECMNDVGLDISKNVRTQITPKLIKEADLIIMMAEKENWPDYLENSPKARFWDVPDAKGTDLAFHISVRNKIEKKVKELIREVG